MENSLRCSGCARGQTFTSSSDKNARLMQNTHVQKTESASAEVSFFLVVINALSQSPNHFAD